MLVHLGPKHFPKRPEELWGEKPAPQSDEQMFNMLSKLVSSAPAPKPKPKSKPKKET